MGVSEKVPQVAAGLAPVKFKNDCGTGWASSEVEMIGKLKHNSKAKTKSALSRKAEHKNLARQHREVDAGT